MDGDQSFAEHDQLVVVKQFQLDNQIHHQQCGIAKKNVIVKGKRLDILKHAEKREILERSRQGRHTVGEKGDAEYIGIYEK